MKITLDDLQCTRKKMGVYFLYNENKRLIYIGESGNIYQRILEHIAEGTKIFSYFKALGFTNQTTAQISEVYLIGALRPKYNRLLIKDFVPFYKSLPTIVENEIDSPDFGSKTTDIIKDDGMFNSYDFNTFHTSIMTEENKRIYDLLKGMDS